MKYFFLVLAVIVFQGNARAQTVDALKEYLHYVYQAEQDIVNANYADAAVQYSNAIKTGFSPYAADVYNYSICAVYNKDYEKVLELSKMLILKGADLAFFKKALYAPFVASPEYKQLVDLYGVLKAKRSKQIDEKLVKELKNYVVIDQSLHSLLHDDQPNGLRQKMNNQDDSLARILSILFKKYNYLPESLIGAHFEDTVLYAGPIWGILVLHEFQSEGALLFEDTKEAIHQGSIRPEVGLEWMEHGNFTHYTFVNNYFVLNDTLREWDIKQARASDSGIFLLAEKPTQKVADLISYFNLDSRENIIDKLYFNYSRFVLQPNSVATQFLLEPRPAIVNGPESLKNQFRVSSSIVGKRRN